MSSKRSLTVLAESLGQHLAELRGQVGFTQTQVARLMSQSRRADGALVSRLEKGKYQSLSLVLVADYLKAIRRSIRGEPGYPSEQGCSHFPVFESWCLGG